MNALTTIFLGVSSVYVGGMIGDHYSESRPEAKAYISGIGPLIAFPLVFLAYSIFSNFWLSMLSYSVTYFPAEMWLGV